MKNLILVLKNSSKKQKISGKTNLCNKSKDSYKIPIDEKNKHIDYRLYGPYGKTIDQNIKERKAL